MTSTTAAAGHVRVVGLGYGAGGRLLDVGSPRLLSAPPATEILDVATAAMARDQDVLVVLPSWRDDLRRAAETARSSVDNDRMVLYSSELPPLAASALVAQAAALSADGMLLGRLAGVLPRLEGGITPFAWLGSVSRLSHLTPSLGQHVRSMAPGSVFMAYAGAEPRVERAKRKEPRIILPMSAARHAIALSAHPGGNRDWVQRALRAIGLENQVLEMAPITESTNWWGTDRLVELALYSREIDELAALDRRPAEACSWCGHEVVTDPCPVCGMRRASLPVSGG